MKWRGLLLALTHQFSRHRSHPRLPGQRARRGVVRYPRKVFFGHSLYLLVMPKGDQYWRYRYRFEGREKLLSLGCFPEVPMERARGHDIRQRGSCWPSASILPGGERRCVKSPPNGSDNLVGDPRKRSRDTLIRERLIPEFLEGERSIVTIVGYSEPALTDPMGQLNPRKRERRGPERLQPQHRRAAPLDRVVILLNDVVEIATRSHRHGLPSWILLTEQPQTAMGRGVSVKVDLLRP